MGEAAQKLTNSAPVPAAAKAAPPSFREKGDISQLRRNVMMWVIEEQYERSVQELKAFLKKDFDYPEYNIRIERYINHCVSLVHAIRAKRRFPGVKSLTMAKQQELKEKFHQHFEELQDTMAKIEKVHHDLRVVDIRSTAIVVRAIVNAAFLVAVVAFATELIRGQGQSILVVVDDHIMSFIDWIFRTFIN